MLFFVTVLCINAFAQQPGETTNRDSGNTGKKRELSTDSAKEIQTILDKYDERFAVMDFLVFGEPAEIYAESAMDTTTINYIVGERSEALDDMVDAKVLAMTHKTGLELRGQVYARPGRHISYDPDDPLVAYNAKIQAELNWNIFHSSIYKRTSKIKELQLQGEIQQLQYEKQALEETVFLQKLLLRNRYYGRLMAILNVHTENLELLMRTQMHLLQSGKISSDNLLKVINEQAEIERQLVSIKADTSIVEIQANPGITYVSVGDTAELMAYIRAEHRDLRRLELRHELLAAQRKNIDYLQTMDIQPFVRFSYYNRENVHNTYNIDLGVSFRIPLTVETAKQRKAIRAEQNVIRYEQQKIEKQVELEVLSILRELESYNENIYGEYMRMAGLKSYLRMRTDSYSNVAGEYSRIDRLMEYNAYLQSWERMLTYAYQRDSKLVELQSYLMDEPVSKYLTFQELR